MSVENTKKVELLAPAGNAEAFYGAIHAGADAVYLAGNQYGARAYADNFSEEDLLKCIRYAHFWKRKVYLTVNTLVDEKELHALPSFLEKPVNAGLDGVIVQDLGVLRTIKTVFPTLPIHASTQMNITGPFGAKLIAKMGAVRIVPARELSLDEIISMKKSSGLEIECFIHGAMCYCYSGRCLLSSMLGGRSGNRGRCAQPCRLSYQISEKISTKTSKGKELYPLSLKDMCTLQILPELIQSGIDSFKIEGRMKKAEYAAGVTAIYRKYIDFYEKNHKWTLPSSEDMESLRTLYCRSDQSEGYYHKHNGKDMITLDTPSYNGCNDVFLSQIRRQYIDTKPTKQIRMDASFRIGKPATLKISLAHDRAVYFIAEGAIVEAPINSPITEQNLKSQLSKLGSTNFSIKENDLTIEMDEKIYLPLKSINELRRDAVFGLEEVIIHGK